MATNAKVLKLVPRKEDGVGKRKHPSSASSKENKQQSCPEVTVEEEIIDLAAAESNEKDVEVLSGPHGGLVRRRALKRRQTSQSPAKGATSGNAGSTGGAATSPAPPREPGLHQQGRRMSADSVVVMGRRSSTASTASAGALQSLVPAAGKAGGVSKENLRLREVLLSQLDVIKKQSQDIVLKDKRLKELQKENEKLKLRLRQMEETSHRRSGTPPPAAAPAQQPQAAAAAGALSLAGSTPEQQRRIQQLLQTRHIIVPQIQKRQSQDKAVLTEISGQLVVPLSLGGATQTTPAVEEPAAKGTKGSKPGKKRRRSGKASSSSAVPTAADKAPKPCKAAPRRKKTFLKSGAAYPLLRGEDQLEWERQEILSILRHSEVPGWRRVPAVPAYSMEGTENIEDDTLLRRHAKPEVAEKRRKRWDIQRAREQRNVARLKARYEQTRWGLLGQRQQGGLVGAEPRTLFPSPEDITHIEVVEELPVSAFGLLAPEMEPRGEEEAASEAAGEFGLSW